MPRPSKTERLQKVHGAALAEFNRAQAAGQDERRQCLEDRRFLTIPGAQWEGALGEQFANKPRFEVNKGQLGLIRLYNEYRNNRVTVDFRPKDGGDNDALADMCDALYRADEQDSCAEEAYDNSFEEAAAGGFGAFRLSADYEDEDDEENERQRIRFLPIYDADTSVFFDVDAKRQDKSDAKRAWVLHSMSVEAFKAEYNQDPATWPKDDFSTLFDWSTPDVVYVAEYYEIERKTETHHVFIDTDGLEVIYSADALEDMSEQGEEVEGSVDAGIAMLAEQGVIKLREKRVKVRQVRKYIMSGAGILEDCGIIAGKYIPVIPVYGKRWYVNNVERMAGFVRYAKDAQRLKNMQLSLLAETSALSPVQKPILLPEQVMGHEVMWQQDNIKNYPYLLINPITDAEGNPIPSGPIGYTQPPQIPQALAALLQLTEQDMAEILGNTSQADKMVSNISAQAVDMIQQRTDMQAFIYMSNFAKAMRRAGEVWLSMAKDIYDEEGRKMKGLGEMGDIEQVEIGKPVLVKGKLQKLTLADANLDVYADVGPSFTSRRDAMVRQLSSMMGMTQDPTDLMVFTALMMFNMDGEGMGDVREFYRKKLVQIGVMQPNEQDMAEAEAAAQNAQPDPQAELVAALAAKEGALATKAQADTEYTIAKTEGEQANTLKTLSELGTEPPAV